MFNYKDLKTTKKEIAEDLDKIEEQIKSLRIRIETEKRIEDAIPLNILPLIVKIRGNIKDYHRLRKIGAVRIKKKQWWDD